MATKTQGTLVEEVRRKLNSLSSRRWSYADIATWINEALSDIARRAENLRSTASLSVNAGDKTISLPATVVRVHVAQFTPTGQTSIYELQYIDPKNAASITWQNTTSGRPAFFWTWGYPPSMTIEMYPKASEAGTLTVLYYANPAPLATDQSAAATNVTIPQGWEDLAVEYCTAEALLSDSDDRWQIYKQKYEEKLAAMTDAATRYVDQSGMIQVGANLVPSWLYDEYY